MRKVLLVAAVFVACGAVDACSSPSPQTSQDVKTGIQITEDLCKEVESTIPNLPEYVQLACTGVDVANQVSTIFLPRATWDRIKAQAAARKAAQAKQ